MRSAHARGVRVVPLVEVADLVRVVSTTSDSTRYIGLANVESGTGHLVAGGDEPVPPSGLAFERGDILFCRLRPYLNKVHLADQPGVCSPEFAVLRIRPGSHVSGRYLAAVLRSSLVVAQTRHMMTGNTHPRISATDVRSLDIPLPSRAMQEDIASGVDARRQEAARLMAEAYVEWQEARQTFLSALEARAAP